MNNKIVTKSVEMPGPQIIIDPEDNDISLFGNSSVMSGNGKVLVITAHNQESSGNDYQGVVNVYRNLDNVWTMEEKLTHDSEGWYPGFGTSVAISDDGRTIVVGTPLSDDDGVLKRGNVRVYTYDGVWSFEDVLTPATAVANKGFGASVAISGDGSTIAVGSVSYIDRNSTHPDTVTLYGLTDGIWRLTQTIDNPREVTSGFGSSVCLNQDATVLAVATLGISSGVCIGTVDTYLVSNGHFSYCCELGCPDGVFGDQYGASLAMCDDGHTIVVGAPNSGDSDTPNGAVYIIESTGNRRTITTLRGTGNEVNYGKSVSISGDGRLILIGVGSNARKAVSTGSVTLCLWDGVGWCESYSFTSGDIRTSEYGVSVCTDIDGTRFCATSHANSYGRSCAMVYTLPNDCDE